MARHTKSKDTKGPDLAQLRAVERLLIDERFDEALERSERLVSAFPQHSGVRGLHIESILASGHADQAAQLTLQWMEQHPNSIRAARLSAIACLGAGLPNLAAAAAERLAVLGEPDPELEQDSRAGARGARSRMGDVDTATALRVEQGLLLCFVGQVAEADQLLAGIEVPLARHALAQTRFQRRDVEGAWTTICRAIDNPAPFPASLFAAVLYSLYLGERDRLGMLTERLNALVPARAEHLFHQISGLLLLDRPGDAVKAFERAPAGLLKRDDDNGIVASLWNAAGVAYARGGDWDKARGLFQQAVDADPDRLSAKINLETAQGRDTGEAPAILELQDWLPESSLRVAVEAISEVMDHGFNPSLRLKHELALTQLSVEGLQREGEHGLSELLSSPDCLLRTRAYQAMRELSAGIEETAQRLVVDADEDGPYAFEDAMELLLVREELAWKHGEDDRALTAWLAHEALGAFELDPDGTRYEGGLEIAPDPDRSAG